MNLPLLNHSVLIIEDRKTRVDFFSVHIKRMDEAKKKLNEKKE